MKRSKWSLTVRKGCLVACQTLLTSKLSAGKQAKVAAKDISYKVADVGVKMEGIGDKLQCVDEKVQVVIDGARGLSRPLLNPSNAYTFQTAIKQQ